MSSATLLIRGARILTLAAGPVPRRGAALRELSVIPHGDCLIEHGRIARVESHIPVERGVEVIEANGRVLMPGFVDCHTHACWAGDRLEEWELRRRGVSYLDILAAGGGIHATVAAVRAASQSELEHLLRERLAAILRGGTTSIEIKSGYGLSIDAELKMLRAIRDAGHTWAGTVVPTALLGHAIEGHPEVFAEAVIADTLPAVSRDFPRIAVDAFCEESAWSLENCLHLFKEAASLGHPIRVHADQFHSLGMISAAVRLRARSVDHLEAATAADLGLLARSETFGVVLPVTAFHTGHRYADARGFVDHGGAIALATNYNPGSAPSHSMPFAMALGVRYGGLTPQEAITAATVNAAAVLDLPRGTIAPGRRADLILLRHRDERALAYELGDNPIDLVVTGGAQIVASMCSSGLAAVV